MNLCIFNGRLTADPELKTFTDGSEYCNFSIAVDRNYKAKDGSRTADFINCKCTRARAKFLAQYFNKGDGIMITGSLESRKYEKDGASRTIYEINVSDISFPVGKKSDGTSAAPVTEMTEEETGELPF